MNLLEPRLFTVEEVAEILRLSTRTSHRLANDGELARIRIGRAVRFAPGDVDAFVERKQRRES